MGRSRKWNATLATAQRGRAAQARQRAASKEVKHVLQQVSGLPCRAETLKVAFHHLIRRDNPSSEAHLSKFR